MNPLLRSETPCPGRRFSRLLLALLTLSLGARAQAPTVTGTTPAPNAVAAPRAGATSVRLSQPLSAGSGAALKVFSNQQGGLRTTATPATVSGSTVSFTPSPTPFRAGETVTGVLTTAAQSSTGTPLARPYVYQFTTQATLAPATYQASGDFGVGRGRFTKLADMDNDGNLDALSVQQFATGAAGGGGGGLSGNALTIVRGDGAGGFIQVFGGLVRYPLGEDQPVDLAVGDVDGDGDLDVVTANVDNAACVLLNNGVKGYGIVDIVKQPNATLPATASDVELADVDGDGDLDMVVSLPSLNALTVLPNAGNGTFGPGQLVSVGGNPQQLAVGDVNRDGSLDVLAGSSNRTVSVRLGTGQGTFAATGQEVPIGASLTNVVLGDLNGDGYLDLVTADVGSYFASVRLNDGAGTFALTGQEIAFSDPTTTDRVLGEVSLGDLDGDGDLDIVATMVLPPVDNLIVQGIGQSFNNGRGAFGPRQFVRVPAGGRAQLSVPVGDLDNDGDLDVLLVESDSQFNVAATFLNSAPVPTITSFTPTSGGATTLVTLTGTDLNSTQRVSFNGLVAPSFTINSPTQVTATVPAGATTGPIVLTTLGGTATSATPYTVVEQVVSLTPARNGNNAPRATNLTLTYSEALNTATASGVRVFSAQAGGRKASQISASGTILTVNPTVDFRPGETVFVTSPATVTSARGLVGQPYVYQFTAQTGVGPGAFSSAADVAVGSGPTSVVPADVNNDGNLDLLVTNYFNNTVSVRLGTGQGTFTGTQELALAGSHTRLRTADVNNDGTLDLLVANAGGTVSVRLGNGLGAFSGTQEVPVVANPQDLVVADLDGDGDLDLATANGSTNTVSVRLNDGTGTFGGTASYAPGLLQLFSLAAGDVDNDGDLDLLVGSSNTGQVAVQLNDGTGTFTAGPAVAIAAPTTSVALGDVNNDGNLDLLATGTTTVSVRLGNGLGSFSGSQEVAVGANQQAVALGDVDGDGDLDVLATLFAGAVSVRLNDGTGTFGGTQQVSVGANANSLALADVDNDGTLDVLTTSYQQSGTVSVRLNRVLCTAPTSVALGPLAPTTAQVSFAGSGTASGGYTATATPTGGGALVSVTGPASPLTLTGLAPNTTYAVVVSSLCANSQTATSSPPVAFTTPCEKPVLTVPTAQTLAADAGQCSATRSFAATATGTPAPTLRYAVNGTPITFPYAFAVGTTTVTVTATNSCQDTDVKSFTVAVQDQQKPVARTQNLTVALVNGMATITPAQVNNGSSDNCTSAAALGLRLDKTAFSCANIGPHQVTLTVTDASGNQSTATATVTVTGSVPTPSIAASPSTTLYLGYGSRTATLTGSGGGPGATYAWSPATGLSTTTGPTTTFTATAEGSYLVILTVTSASGCSASTTVTLTVEDVQCGTRSDKVLVCHNGQAICVAPAAVSTHLGHGDQLGACPSKTMATSALAVASRSSSAPADATPLLEAYPNPFTASATVRFRASQDGAVRVVVYNVLGQPVATLYDERAPAGQVVERTLGGTSLAAGVYTIRLTGGGQSLVQKVVLTK